MTMLVRIVYLDYIEGAISCAPHLALRRELNVRPNRGSMPQREAASNTHSPSGLVSPLVSRTQEWRKSPLADNVQVNFYTLAYQSVCIW